jgi:hypothetical protein
VIFNPLHFRELFFTTFMFVYVYSNFTKNLREGGVDFSLLFYTVTNFRQPRHCHMVSRGVFVTRLGRVAPLKDG